MPKQPGQKTFHFMGNMDKTCKITFQPMGLWVELPPGSSLLEAAASAGIEMRSECGGKGLCGKCRLRIYPKEAAGEPEEKELELFLQEELAEGWRLACLCRALGELQAEVPQESLESKEASGKTNIRGRYNTFPAVRRVFLGNEASGGRQGVHKDLVGYVLERMAAAGVEPRAVWWDPQALKDLSSPGLTEGDLTLVWHRQKGITGVRKGFCRRSLGAAMDVGTTTLAVYLCDLTSGEILTSAGGANPQRKYGEDVISRIAHASQAPGGLENLHRAVVEGLNGLLGKCLNSAGASQEDLDELVAVGNTTMLEILAGMNPQGLGAAPYLPVTVSPQDLRGADLGLEVGGGVNLHLLPVISGFVGADTLAAVLAQEPHKGDQFTLIVDIGTNGELVLGNSQALWATSCATGPALEGAHISCGMRAVAGAVHRVWEEDGRISWEVLKGGSRGAKGICGSGIIDAMAAMRKAGILLPSGRLREGAQGVMVDSQGVGRSFRLVEAAHSATGKPLSIELEDVRQVQLAKAALYVGVKFLMRRAGVEKVDRLVLTGAFGARFDWRSAVSIGMIPREAASGLVEVVENAAGVGAVMALLDCKKREEAWELASRVQVLELAQEPDFGMEYPMAMGFPPLEAESDLS